MSLNDIIKKVSAGQLANIGNIDNNETITNMEQSKDNINVKIDTRKQNKVIINSIFSDGSINIADVDTRYSDAVNLHVVKNWEVAQIGAGGIGSPVVQTLVGMGISNYTLFDDDTVEVHNCGPQMHPIINIGKSKVQSTAEQMYAFRGITINEKKQRVHALSELKNNDKVYDVIINSVDNMDIRRTLGWELLSDIFEKYKGYSILLPKVSEDGTVSYSTTDASPIEVCIPTLLHDINVILTYIKKEITIKSINEFMLLNVDKLGLSDITVKFLTVLNTKEADQYGLGIVNLLKNSIALTEDTEAYSKYLHYPYKYNGKIFTTLLNVLSLLMVVQKNFIFGHMHETIKPGSVIPHTTGISELITDPYTDVTLSVETESNKYMVLPILHRKIAYTVDEFKEYVDKLVDYVETNIPEVYIDSRMSLGAWNTYTLLLKDAYYQHIYLYYHIYSHQDNGAAYLDTPLMFSDKLLPISKVDNIPDIDVKDALNTYILNNRYTGIDAATGDINIVVDTYFKNLGSFNAATAICLTEFLTEALFDGSEAIQEPCTARAIVYTGVNIASYIGAILHYISSRQFTAGDIQNLLYGIYDDINTDANTDLFRPDKLFNVDVEDVSKPFRWRHFFNSRSFMSANDTAFAATRDRMMQYKKDYLTLSNTVEQQIPFIREKLLSTFELQNIYVLSYIGAVLHIASTKQDLGKYKEGLFNIPQATKRFYQLFEIHYTDITVDKVSKEAEELTESQVSYLYTLFLFMLLSCGYIKVEDLHVDKELNIDVPIHFNKKSIYDVFVNDTLFIDKVTWDMVFKDDEGNVGNSLLTLMPSYREYIEYNIPMLLEMWDMMESAPLTESIIKLEDSLIDIINIHIALSAIDSTALGISNVQPHTAKDLNIVNLINELRKEDSIYNKKMLGMLTLQRKERYTLADSLVIDDIEENLTIWEILGNRLFDHLHEKLDDNSDNSNLYVTINYGVIDGDFLLKESKCTYIRDFFNDPLKLRLYYPLQLLCNIVHTNTLDSIVEQNTSNSDENTLLEKNNKIRVFTQNVLCISQKPMGGTNTKHLNDFLDTFSSKEATLISSNGMLCNGILPGGKYTDTQKTTTYGFTLLVNKNLTVPFSYQNFEIGTYNPHIIGYAHRGASFKSNNGDVFKNLKVSDDKIRLYNNISMYTTNIIDKQVTVEENTDNEDTDDNAYIILSGCAFFRSLKTNIDFPLLSAHRQEDASKILTDKSKNSTMGVIKQVRLKPVITEEKQERFSSTQEAGIIELYKIAQYINAEHVKLDSNYAYMNSLVKINTGHHKWTPLKEPLMDTTIYTSKESGPMGDHVFVEPINDRLPGSIVYDVECVEMRDLSFENVIYAFLSKGEFYNIDNGERGYKTTGTPFDNILNPLEKRLFKNVNRIKFYPEPSRFRSIINRDNQDSRYFVLDGGDTTNGDTTNDDTPNGDMPNNDASTNNVSQGTIQAQIRRTNL